MKVGLFVCDHVNPDMREKFVDYPDMFAILFPDLEWEIYDVINGVFPDSLTACDVYMTTGSRYSVYQDIPWINKLKSIIVSIYALNKKFVGVCFGHQLIAESLGGKVEKSDNGWCIGIHKFNIQEKRSWMDPFEENVHVLMMCQDQISELPPNTSVLGGSGKCPNGIIQIGENILGIQAHPEYTAEYNHALFSLRKDRIGPSTIAKGIESLSLGVDRERIRDWVLKFIDS